MEFLLEKRTGKKQARLRQDWVGVLKCYHDQYYTSLELQKKALEWRGD